MDHLFTTNNRPRTPFLQPRFVSKNRWGLLVPLLSLAMVGCPEDEDPAGPTEATTCAPSGDRDLTKPYLGEVGADTCTTEQFCFAQANSKYGICQPLGDICTIDSPASAIDGEHYPSEQCLDGQDCVWSDKYGYGFCKQHGAGGTSGSAGASGSSGTGGSGGSGGASGTSGTGGTGGNAGSSALLGNTLTSGTTQPCDGESVDFEIPAAPTEVLHLRATWSAPPNAPPGGGAGARAEIWKNGTVLMFGGNPLGLNTVLPVAPGAPRTSDLVYGFTDGGPLTLRFFNESPACSDVIFVASYESVAAAATNLTKQTASPLAPNTAVTGHESCEEERWYSVTLTAGQPVTFSLRAKIFPGWPANNLVNLATVEDESGTTVGNILEAGASSTTQFGDAVTLMVTPSASGQHFVRLFNDFFSCGLSQYEISYQ